MSAKDLCRQLLAALAHLLRPRGFRGSGPGFRRALPDIAHLVAVQKSDSCTAERMKFTLNVGVWSRDVSLATGKGDAPPGSVSRCPVRTRIGDFTPDRRDVWWDVCDEGDLVSACASVEGLLVNGALPRLEEMRDADSLLEAWVGGRPFLKPGVDYERHVDLLRGALDARRHR